jgi:hypothetical protein
MPVILIPFLTIQKSWGRLNRRVMSSRYGGAGSSPLTHCSRATEAAPWHATQCVSYRQKPASTWAGVKRAGASTSPARRRTEWTIVSCVSHSVKRVCGLDAAALYRPKSMNAQAATTPIASSASMARTIGRKLFQPRTAQ